MTRDEERKLLEIIDELSGLRDKVGDACAQQAYGYMSALLEGLVDEGLIPKTIAEPVLQRNDIHRKAVTVDFEEVHDEQETTENS